MSDNPVPEQSAAQPLPAEPLQPEPPGPEQQAPAASGEAPKRAAPELPAPKPVAPKPVLPKLTGELRFGKLAAIEGAKGLLYLGAILLGLYGLTLGTHPAVRLVSGLIILCGALAGAFWPAEFKKYIAWFELDGEFFKYRLLRARKKQKVALAKLRARSRSSRGERYACAINVGDYEEVVVMFPYVTNGRELWDRLQGLMAERASEE